MANVLITGANRGIGLEVASRLQQRGDAVTVLCRSSSNELQALDVEIIEGVDVTDPDSLQMAAGKLKGRSIDWLINNAGILERTSLDNMDFEAMERQFRVNSLGPLRVTAALLDKLSSGSRVFIVTSRMGSIEDNTSGGSYGYRMSKAAVNMAGKSLSVDLKDAGIGVYLLHPGWVATDMTQGTGIAVEESAAGLVRTMDSLGLEQTGTFWHQEGYELPW
ncbi:MAG: SDR family oxidoreductase [Xanthomonadales bacterium]|jgi:NAD(P)-dependent dehydrogenase (short-subunit alcohol dehydrogenase family)|nr:SDR family oxidoreductase [Xanthomonadales bacterium]